MSTLSPEAAMLKYEYNRKYQDRYWEKKAASKSVETTPLSKCDPNETPTINRLDYIGQDEKYIKGLEIANKCMRSENRRLIKLLHNYQTMIAQSNIAML